MDLFSIEDMYPNIMSKHTIIDKKLYERHVLGIFDLDDTKGGATMTMRMDEDNDIRFLFETKTWNGINIQNMKSSHIINTLSMLNREASKLKFKYELFVIDNSENELLVPRDNIYELAETRFNGMDYEYTYIFSTYC